MAGEIKALSFTEGRQITSPTEGVTRVGTATGASSLEAVNLAYLTSIGAGLKNNSTTTDPTVSNDSSESYSVNSVWTNTTTDESFICQDNSVGAAVWSKIVDAESAQSIGGIKTFTDTTQSTSKDTGGVVFEGGVGIEKNLHVGGDLTVEGDTTTVNTATLDVEDANIGVNKGGNQATANSNVAGVQVQMTDATNAQIGYDSSLASKFKAGEVASEHEVMTTGHAQTVSSVKTFTATPDFEASVNAKQIATPANPAAGDMKFYPKSGDQFYQLNSAGIEKQIGDVTTTNGDLVYRTGGILSRLGIGTAGQILQVAAGLPIWAANPGATPTYTFKTDSYTILTTDQNVEIDAATDKTFTLPTAIGNDGFRVRLIAKGAGTHNIATTSSQTVGGFASGVLKMVDKDVYEVVSNGTNWDIISKPQPKTGYVKDEKTNGTNGGSSTADTIHTRDLNTSSGDFSKFATLSSNQVTLQSGEYIIEAFAPAFRTGSTVAFWYNVTDATYDLEGMSAYSDTGDQISVMSRVDGKISITSTKTYELRHYIVSAKVTDGLGVAAGGASNPQTVEVYSVVKITKLA